MTLFYICILCSMLYHGTMSLITGEVPLTGKISYELYLDIDNTDSDAEFYREVEATSIIKTDYEELEKTVIEVAAELTLGFNVGPGVVIAKVGFYAEVGLKVQTLFEQTIYTKTEQFSESTSVETFRIGPNSHLQIYRKFITAPGLFVQTDGLFTQPGPEEEFEVEVTVTDETS